MQRLEKTRAFLTEFIIVVLFFTISAIVVVRLFVAANKNSTESILVTDCYLKSESIAENIKSTIYGDKEIEECMDKFGYSKSDLDENHYVKYFDKELKEAKKDKAYIIGFVDVVEKNTDTGILYDIAIIFEDSEKEISNVSFKVYESEGN